MKQLSAIFLLLTGVIASPSLAADVPWIEKVTTPPETLPEPSRPLPDLLTGASGEAIDTLAAWKVKRATIRRQWLDFLGPLPQRPEEDVFEVLSEEKLETVIRRRIRYEAEEGRFVEAYLLIPRGESEGPRPGVVVFHATTPETNSTVAGLGGDRADQLGLRLAERGFVAICPENYLWEESSYLKAVAAAKERNRKSLGMATMLGDGMRAVDLLTEMPGVDPDAIGTIGHSLGAKEALYLMAFDERVKAGVASEGGIGLDSTNWDDPWYLGPAINEPEFERSHAELIALIAPRPFLVFGGESGRGASDGDRSWPYLLAARPIYELYGKPFRAGLWNHRTGHRFEIPMMKKSIAWLEVYLGGEGDRGSGEGEKAGSDG